MEIIRNLLIVGCGSFIGGGLRYGISRFITTFLPATVMPIATFLANLLGCFLIGVFYALSNQGTIGSNTKLFLTVGLCGGLTTFSTFMNENVSFARSADITSLAFYIILSLLCGFFAIIAGNMIVK